MPSRKLKNIGLKVTGPRVSILQLFQNNAEKHLSAEEVFKALTSDGEDVGLATVYRVLSQFEQAGILKRHNFVETHAVYELNEKTPHDHLVCVRCNAVHEFTDEIIAQRQQELVAAAGFKMTDHCLNIYGICSNCQ